VSLPLSGRFILAVVPVQPQTCAVVPFYSNPNSRWMAELKDRYPK